MRGMRCGTRALDGPLQARDCCVESGLVNPAEKTLDAVNLLTTVTSLAPGGDRLRVPPQLQLIWALVEKKHTRQRKIPALVEQP